jgi:hypothetical protein
VCLQTKGPVQYDAPFLDGTFLRIAETVGGVAVPKDF